ncbi:COMM domain-containing protein 6-like [Mya arenaria]|uniref:COMM domain-containing protein 6-like n=1 Tax=Mya arenaria TaxID=6604 RepID=UPI0022E5E784|nr:COMM domain-containing protein 6-like [Mya arenaria]
MADILQGAPDGFGAAVTLMNQLNADHLSKLSKDVIQFLQYTLGVVNTDSWCKKVQESGTKFTKENIQNIINALIYLYRSSAKADLSEEDFMSMLSSSTVFQPSSCSCLSAVWTEQRHQLQSSNIKQHILGVGQLLDIQWKVGVAVSSDQCRNLNSPYVTLTLTVADPDGSVKIHTLELTTIQFRNFTNQLKEIGRMLDMV